MILLRLRASAHEMRCWECRVTWLSWLQRLAGMKRGYTPRLSKLHRALVTRAQRAEAAVQAVLAFETSDAGPQTDETQLWWDGHDNAVATIHAIIRSELDQPKETR